MTGFAGTAVSLTFSAVSSQTGQDFNTTLKMKSNFLKKYEKTKWGQKFRQVLTGPRTAVSPTFSAVFRQTGQDINTTLKRKCDFLRNFEKTKWGQKFRQGHTGANTAVSPFSLEVRVHYSTGLARNS